MTTTDTTLQLYTTKHPIDGLYVGRVAMARRGNLYARITVWQDDDPSDPGGRCKVELGAVSRGVPFADSTYLHGAFDLDGAAAIAADELAAWFAADD